MRIKDSVIVDAPRIERVRLGSDGAVRLNVIGRPEGEFRVLGSPDARNWIVIGTGRSDFVGVGEYSETGAATNRHRFYRIEWP